MPCTSCDRRAGASPPFKPDISQVANAGGVRIVAVTKHCDINQMRRRRILPDRAINASEVDLLVKPAANPVVAGVGNEVREAADIFVLARS